MAKNTKGDGSLEPNGVTVVTPDNIGVGVKWNPATKKFDVNVAQNQPIVVNDNGELEVRISQLENNQLRLMKDGLYYGDKARPELANLYVDAISGVDQDPLEVQGAGTRAKPLKTVAYATKLVESGSSSAILLHEDQEHVIDRTKGTVHKANVVVQYRIYGSKNDAEYKKQGNNQYSASLQASLLGYAPKLVFKGFATSYYQPASGAYTLVSLDCLNFNNSNVDFSGIHLVNDLDFVATVRSDGFDHTTRSPNYVANASRINLSGAGVVGTRCCRVSSRGTPRLDGPLNNNISDEYNFQQYKRTYSGKYNSSFFMSSGNYSFVTRDMFGVNDMNCYFLGSYGWGAKLGSSVNLVSEGNIHPSTSDLTSRIYAYTEFTQPSGDKVILAPSTNIPASEWKGFK